MKKKDFFILSFLQQRDGDASAEPEAEPSSHLKVTDVRLPRHLVPESYRLKLIPFIVPDNFTIRGYVEVPFDFIKNKIKKYLNFFQNLNLCKFFSRDPLLTMAKDPSHLRALNNGKFYFVDNETLHFTFKLYII